MSSTYPVLEKMKDSKGGIRRRTDTTMEEEKEQNDKV